MAYTVPALRSIYLVLKGGADALTCLVSTPDSRLMSLRDCGNLRLRTLQSSHGHPGFGSRRCRGCLAQQQPSVRVSACSLLRDQPLLCCLRRLRLPAALQLQFLQSQGGIALARILEWSVSFDCYMV